MRKRKPEQKKIRKAIGKQLHYLARNLKSIDVLIATGGMLSTPQQLGLETIHKMYEQQKSMYDRKSHQVSGRIVSLSQPWLRPIARGKDKAAVAFGAKLDISVVNGWTRLESFSFTAYISAAIARYHERTGRYPARVLADKSYRNRANRTCCRERSIRLSGSALGRQKKDAILDKKQNYRDECEWKRSVVFLWQSGATVWV